MPKNTPSNNQKQQARRAAKKAKEADSSLNPRSSQAEHAAENTKALGTMPTVPQSTVTGTDDHPQSSAKKAGKQPERKDSDDAQPDVEGEVDQAAVEKLSELQLGFTKGKLTTSEHTANDQN